MNVIRNHAPSRKLVAFIMEELQRFFAELCDPGIAQIAFADATVEVALQLGPAFAEILDFQEVFPFATTTGGQGIGEAEGSFLQIGAGMPKASSFWSQVAKWTHSLRIRSTPILSAINSP